jgi:nucleoside phosphorylase
MENQQSTDVVIITALDKERDAVLRYLDSPQQIQSKNRIVYKSNLPHDNADSFYQVVLLCLNNMGNVSAGIATTQAIDVWNPSLIMLVGITGGIENGDERYLGDLVAAEQIVGYEAGKLTDAGAERRYDVLRSTHTFVEAARNFPDEKWVLAPTIPRPDGKDGRVIPKIHWGIVASGEKVIADTKTVPELQNIWAKLVGIEMEGYGTALAAYTAESRPDFFMVKGICDWANPDKNDKWQKYAADVAAVFVINLLRSKPFVSQSNKHQPQIKKSLHYSGKIKIQFCRQLGKDWQDLATCLEIPAHRCNQFPQGRECHAIWEWLEERKQLHTLKEALGDLDRQDLVELLNTNNKG